MGEYSPDDLHDDDEMPFGKHKGESLGAVPDDYWLWFLKQPWCDDWPLLVRYANNVVDDDAE